MTIIRYASLLFFCLSICFGAKAQGLKLDGTWKHLLSDLHLRLIYLEGSASEGYKYRIVFINKDGSAAGTWVIKPKLGNAFGEGTLYDDNQVSKELELVTTFASKKDGNIDLIKIKFNNEARSFTRVGDNSYDVISQLEMPKTAKLTKVVVTKLNPVKSSGATWDDAFGQYKPDVFCKFFEGANLAWSSKRIDNASGMIEWEVYAPPIIQNLNTPIKVELLDDDVTSSPDMVLTSQFRLIDFRGKEYLTIAQDGTEMRLYFEWK